jgi:hypothetical protein
VAVAVAVEGGGGALGRCRLRVAGARPAAALGRLVREVVEPGAAVCVGRRGAVPTRVGEVADVVEAWLQGPLHGAVSAGHLQSHLDEVAFRFGGRGQRPPGALFARLLRRAVATGPVRAAELVHRAAPRRAPTVPPVAPVLPPPRTGTLLADRPWRAA